MTKDQLMGLNVVGIGDMLCSTNRDFVIRHCHESLIGMCDEAHLGGI